MSDRIWNWLGRRRPYFLVGAVLSSLALFVMPDSTGVRMAASFCGSGCEHQHQHGAVPRLRGGQIEPDQRTVGFVTQSFFIGVGATLANALPYIFRYFGVNGRTPSGIPLTVQYSFKIGAVAFLLAVLWTIFTTKEYPPDDLAEFERKRREHKGIMAVVTAPQRNLLGHRRDAWHDEATRHRQLFTWLGLFCMWLFFGLMTSYHIFGATSPQDARFPLGGEWGGICFMVYSIVTFLVAFVC